MFAMYNSPFIQELKLGTTSSLNWVILYKHNISSGVTEFYGK